MAESSTSPRQFLGSCKSKCVAMEYEVWFPQVDDKLTNSLWAYVWGIPILGAYNSSDSTVIDKHAEWFAALGIDFLIIDWSNSSANYVANDITVDANTRNHTDAVFLEYKKLSRDKKQPPRLSILLGAQNEGGITQKSVVSSGALQDEANFVYDSYVKKYPDLYYLLNGKPLLIVYTGFSGDPGWRDSRFTVKIMSATLESQQNIWSHQSTNTIWSWYDRDPLPSHDTVVDKAVQTVTVTQAYPGGSGWADKSNQPPWDPRPAAGRSDGVFTRQWAKAVSYDPQIIILNQWNEFVGGRTPSDDQYTTNFSNDIEPTKQIGCGPMASVQQAIAAWKGITLPSIDCSAASTRADPSAEP